MKFVFAGTPQIGAWALDDLVAGGRRPELVVSQPDRPAGRGRACTAPPVVEAARNLDVPWMQAADINDLWVLDRMSQTGAEVLVVAAFGQIFRDALLDRFLCLNIHPSLLPRHRGAAPVRRSLMEGDEETGVGVIRLTAGLDEGPIAVMRRIQIDLRDDHASLARGLALFGSIGVREALDGLTDGTLQWTEQEGEATYATKIVAADRVLNVHVPARSAHDRVRALSPDIGVDVSADGVDFKLWRTWPWDDETDDSAPPAAVQVAGSPGRLAVTKHRMFAGCARGALEILELQPSGKKRMSADEFIRGYGTKLPDRLAQAGGVGEPAGT